MGKYENMMKCAQIRTYANEKQYNNAHDVLKTLNVNHITAIADLNTIADVYIQLKKYSEAKDVYLKLYDKIQTRRILYQLVYLSIKCEEMEDAEAFLEDYKKIDKTVDHIILRYYIDKAKGLDRKVLIGHLQELKKEEYIEEWAYELAKLYHKEGMEKECVAECSDIILWFSEGLIVEKAMLLRHHYVDGADISSEGAILRETKNLASELKIAAAIAERNERIKAKRKALHEKQIQKESEEKSTVMFEDGEQLEEEQFIEQLTQSVERELREETIGKVKIKWEEDFEKKVEELIENEEKQEILTQKEESFSRKSKKEQLSGRMRTRGEFKQAVAKVYGGIKSIAQSHNEDVYTKEQKEEPIEEKIEEQTKQQIEQEEFKMQEDIKESIEPFSYEEKGEQIEDWQEEIQLTEIDIENLDTIDNEENFFEQTKQKIIIKIEEIENDTKVQEAISEIINDMKMQNQLSHIAIMGNNYDKNIELGKNIVKELYRQQVIKNPKIARIHAGKLSTISLQDNRQKLLGACLLIEQAGIISLDSLQNLCQFINRSSGKVVVIFCDMEINMKELLKKNRKLEALINYHIEI